MLARGTTVLRSASSHTLALCLQAQVLLLELDRAHLRPLEVLRRTSNANARGAASPSLEVVGIDALWHPDAGLNLVAIARSSASDNLHEIVIAYVSAGAATAEADGKVQTATLALDFPPLIAQWLRLADTPTLAVSDAESGRLHVFTLPQAAAPPADTSPVLVELEDTQSSDALGGLARRFQAPVLALAEWRCPHSGCSARVAASEDGTVELLAQKGWGEAPARQWVRVERPVNVAFFFEDSLAAASPGEPPVVHLFAGSVLCGACFFADVLRNGLRAPVLALPDSVSVLCGSPWRAQPSTLLVGTWCRTLYCLQLRCVGEGASREWSCRLVWSRELPHALYGIDMIDATCDGLDEIVVRTLQGLHVLQEELAGVCAELRVGLAELLRQCDDEASPSAGGAGGRDALSRALSRTGAIAELQVRLKRHALS
mmetsp:Transcript_34262/g.85335  ORF Transcript_34262/g.85335 Transcript_34262/m.85335 type:complete len:430 (+) Transcript_34262:3-1292(+)